jgi:hypothetical protein
MNIFLFSDLSSITGCVMLTYAIRISHDVAEAYQEAMAMTFKDFQVSLDFSDYHSALTL